MKYIVDCVIILHNMTIVYEKDMEQLHIEDYENATQIEMFLMFKS
jgi:hypothetical protein